MISVPVTPDTVAKTLQQLPRIPSEAGFVEVGIKRKMEYDRSHRKELIDPKKIFMVLENLKKCGHPYYQNFDDYTTYEMRCKEQDEHGHQMLFGNADMDNDSDVASDDGEEVVNNM